MAKYILTKQHFINNVLLEPGTVLDIGDDMPSLGMAAEEGDSAAAAKCKERDDKQRAKTQAAVARGTLSNIAAENIMPKAEAAPAADDEGHARRPRR